VCLRAAQLREREAVADLDALHRLNPHQRRGKPRVEAVVLARIRAEPGRNALRTNLDDAAERVAILPRGVDRVWIRACLRQRDARHAHADLPQQRLRHRPRRDVHRCVPRRRALERVAYIHVPVLLHAREIRVTRPRQRHRLRPLARRLAFRRPRVHPPRPVLVIAIPHDERERRPERAPLPEAREHLDLVGLDLLSRRPAVALLPPPQI
jgi:hypothetical protein